MFHMPKSILHCCMPGSCPAQLSELEHKHHNLQKLVSAAWKNPRNSSGAIISGTLCCQGFDGTEYNVRKNKDSKTLSQEVIQKN